MENFRCANIVRMVVPNVATVQALLVHTPASLTLETPSAVVQVQVISGPLTDRWPLSDAQRRQYS